MFVCSFVLLPSSFVRSFLLSVHSLSFLCPFVCVRSFICSLKFVRSFIRSARSGCEFFVMLGNFGGLKNWQPPKIEYLCGTEVHTKKVRPTDELVFFSQNGLKVTAQRSRRGLIKLQWWRPMMLRFSNTKSSMLFNLMTGGEAPGISLWCLPEKNQS